MYIVKVKILYQLTFINNPSHMHDRLLQKTWQKCIANSKETVYYVDFTFSKQIADNQC